MSFHRLGFLLTLPTVVGLSLAACGTEDDAAPPPATGGTGANGGSEENGGTGETGGTGATGGMTNPEGGTGGHVEPGQAGAGGDSAGGAAGAGGDGPGNAGSGNSAGEGGEGGGAPAPVPCHVILANFDADPGGSIGKYVPDSSSAEAKTSTVSWNSTEGVTAMGAGRLEANFSTLGDQAQLGIYFPAGTQWATCNTKLHAKVKLHSATDLSHINDINLNINSGNNNSVHRYSLKVTSTASWTMDTWYSVEFAFASSDYADPSSAPLPDFTDVNAIGVMLQSKTTGATPVPTTMYVDDIWVE